MSKEIMFDLLIKYGSVVLILIIGIIIIKVVLKIEKKTLEKSKLDDALHTFIINSSKIILWIVLIVLILGQLNVKTAPILTILGAGGAAVALALKDSLGNIAGGIIILINKPFERGDTVETNGIVGKIDSIDLLTTRLLTFDNKVVTVPNGSVTNSVLVNYSAEGIRRVDCTFGISYGADINKAKELLRNVSDSCPDILKNVEPVIGVSAQDESAVKLDYFVWCPTEKYYDVRYFMIENVKIAFEEANIDIPFPQIDVHVIK